jgi:hypothetical protein
LEYCTHTDLIGTYTVTAKQNKLGNNIVSNELQLTCMTLMDPATGWLKITEVPTYD